MPHRDVPPRECRLCGRTTWWCARRPGSPWICGVCVPPALEPDEVEWLDSAPATEPPLRDVRFTRAFRQLARPGLLGWLAFGIGANWCVDAVAIRRALDGRLALSFPSRTDARVSEHVVVRPAGASARPGIERAVLADLGVSPRREEPHQLPRPTRGISRTQALANEQPDQPASNLGLGGPHAAQGIAP